MDAKGGFDGFERTLISGTDTANASQTSLRHYLVGVEGKESGKFIELGPEPVTIGRDARQTLVFADDSQVSRLHARVLLADDAVVVEDLGSTNGTFVNAQRVASRVTLREGSVVRVGRQLLKYERRDPQEVARARELTRDLQRASNYVHSMLPAPIESGRVRAQWSFVPSTALGGDAFGYAWLDDDTFAAYLLDVSGHGVGAAMHSVSVMNVLRQRALPGVDFADPGQVLSSLNDRFQMESHDGLFFTIWYGVYRASTRRLAYSAAGHHAAYLVPSERGSAAPLERPDLMIGAVPQHTYECTDAPVAPGATLLLFSDGAFEIVTADGQRWSLSNLVPHLSAPMVPGVSDPDRVYRIIRDAARPGPLDDDLSILAVTFV